MKSRLAMLAGAALSLTACGVESTPNQSGELNQLEAGENAIWNDLATVPAEENLATETPAPEGESPRTDEPQPAPAPSSERSPSPGSATPAPRETDTAAKKAPVSRPPAGERVTPPTQPEPEAKAPCTPEHAAMGHCRP